MESCNNFSFVWHKTAILSKNLLVLKVKGSECISGPIIGLEERRQCTILYLGFSPLGTRAAFEDLSMLLAGGESLHSRWGAMPI